MDLARLRELRCSLGLAESRVTRKGEVGVTKGSKKRLMLVQGRQVRDRSQRSKPQQIQGREPCRLRASRCLDPAWPTT